MLSIQDHMLLWYHATIKVQDVRHITIHPGDSLSYDSLPASVFVYIARGKAAIQLDEAEYTADKCQVCHAGGGASFHIVHVTEATECYMVYYKAEVDMPERQQHHNGAQLQRRNIASDPFSMQYGFAPRSPLALFLKMEQMNRQWQQTGALAKYHVKALFHQFVYELLQQLQELDGLAMQPRTVTQAIGYLEERYSEPITLHSLADVLNCNARQLQRLFKSSLKMGPMEYLIKIRLEKAKELLRHTDVPLTRISEAVGYADSYYCSRLFKKYVGVSPRQYREQAKSTLQSRKNPLSMSRSDIVSSKLKKYSYDYENENHYQIKGAASTWRNMKHMKGKVMLDRLPEKIAVLDHQYIDQLLALGKRPIGSVIATSDAPLFPDYLSDKLSGVEVLGTKEEPDLAAIAQAVPDLIICTQFHEGIYEQLSGIAPTLMLDRNEDWRTTMFTFGKLVGKEHDVFKMLDHYHSKIAGLKAALAGKLAGGTVALIRPRDNMIRLHTTAHRTAEILYQDLDLAAPSCAMNNMQTSSAIPFDALYDLNADHLFVLQDDSNSALTGQIRNSAEWQRLRAVRANRVYTVNTTVWIGYYGPIAMNLIIEDIARALL